MAAYRQHTHRHAFFWGSGLSDEMKDQLIAWVKGLAEEDAEMLNLLLEDVREAEQDDADEQAAF